MSAMERGRGGENESEGDHGTFITTTATTTTLSSPTTTTTTPPSPTDVNNSFLSARLELLLHDAKVWGVNTQEEALAFLGQRFRTVMTMHSSVSDVKVGVELLDRHILVHVASHAHKCESLLMMARKLYAFVQGKCKEDNADAMANQELLL